MTPDPHGYDDLIHIIRKRRSVRRFEPGQSVPRETLLQIAEADRQKNRRQAAKPALPCHDVACWPPQAR